MVVHAVHCSPTQNIKFNYPFVWVSEGNYSTMLLFQKWRGYSSLFPNNSSNVGQNMNQIKSSLIPTLPVLTQNVAQRKERKDN